jgi:NifU-like protein involved in Fe-S cluster formation
MIEDLYNSKIMSWSAQLITPCRLADPHVTAEVRGRLCGSTFRVDLSITNGIITEYGHAVTACRVGSAAAAFLHANIIGTSISDMRSLAEWMERMLMRDSDPPLGRWRDLDMFLPLRGNRFRSGTALLPFQAVVRALDQNLT